MVCRTCRSKRFWSSSRADRNRLQPTTDVMPRPSASKGASEQRVKELEDLQAAQEMRYNRAEYQRVTLLQMHHSMDAVMQEQKQEIERMRGGSEPS